MRYAGLSFLGLAVFLGCGSEVITTSSGTSSSSSSSSSSTSSSSGNGGFGGSGGSGTGAGGTVVSPPPECSTDAECMLLNDCCRCEGLAPGETAPDCPSMECFALSCESIGIGQPATVCRAGQCVVDADCNQAHAICKSLPPVCPPGKTPIVVNGCWGGCIAVSECGEVGSCTQCQSGQACVNTNTMMIPGKHCVDPPASCNGQISCECMGKNVCGFATGCVQMVPTELQCVDITTK